MVKVFPITIMDRNACQGFVEQILVFAIIERWDVQRHERAPSQSTGKRDAQTNSFTHLRGNQLIVNGRDGSLRVIRVRFDVDRLDEDTRLPLLQGLGNAVRDQLSRGDSVRLEQIATQVP